MKWTLMIAALLAGTAQIEVWTCEMQSSPFADDHGASRD